jgi:hypothetical protein
MNFGILNFYHGDVVGVGSPKAMKGSQRWGGGGEMVHPHPLFGPLPICIILNKMLIVFTIPSINELWYETFAPTTKHKIQMTCTCIQI